MLGPWFQALGGIIKETAMGNLLKANFPEQKLTRSRALKETKPK